MGAADAIHLVDIQQLQRRGNERILFQRPRRRYDDNSLHTRDLRRDDIHQNR